MSKFINKRNGIIAAIAVVLVIAAIIFSTTFTQAMTLDEAKEIARLKRELRDAQDALEVLKKAINILGK